MLTNLKIRRRQKKQVGAVLVEYALVIAGVALITAAAVAIFGHKVNDMIATVATVLPGAHADDNGPIASGKIIETTAAASGEIEIDAATISGNTDTGRLANNVGIAPADLETLVTEQ